MAEPTIDPNAQYSPPQLAAMRQALAVEDNRKAEATAEARRLYAIPVKEMISTPEWAAVRDRIATIRSSTQRDDNLFIHMDSLSVTMDRLEHGALQF